MQPRGPGGMVQRSAILFGYEESHVGMRWLDSIMDSIDTNLQALGDSGGQRSLECCSPQGSKESDTTQPLQNNKNKKDKNSKNKMEWGRKENQGLLDGETCKMQGPTLELGQDEE